MNKTELQWWEDQFFPRCFVDNVYARDAARHADELQEQWDAHYYGLVPWPHGC